MLLEVMSGLLLLLLKLKAELAKFLLLRSRKGGEWWNWRRLKCLWWSRRSCGGFRWCRLVARSRK